MKLVKWFKAGPFALFDLAEDPGEVVNLVENSDYQKTFHQLRTTLARPNK
jgi:hypothetical protein